MSLSLRPSQRRVTDNLSSDLSLGDMVKMDNFSHPGWCFLCSYEGQDKISSWGIALVNHPLEGKIRGKVENWHSWFFFPWCSFVILDNLVLFHKNFSPSLAGDTCTPHTYGHAQARWACIVVTGPGRWLFASVNCFKSFPFSNSAHQFTSAFVAPDAFSLQLNCHCVLCPPPLLLLFLLCWFFSLPSTPHTIHFSAVGSLIGVFF